MPRDFFGSSPADAPLSYPGSIPDFSYVLTGRRELVRLQPRKGRRLGQAIVYYKELADDPTCTSLNYLLLANNAAPIDERVPVVAIGSNAAPAQLASKFAAEDVSPVVPVVAATAVGLRVLPSAHVNQSGYVPWAPHWSAHAPEMSVFVTFLDARQLARLDETEPNYTRLPLPAASQLVTLPGSGEALDGCHVYASAHGVITDSRVLSSNSVPDQHLLLTRILALLPKLQGDDGREISNVTSFVAAIRGNQVDAEHVTKLVKRHVRFVAARPTEVAGSPPAYRDQPATLIRDKASALVATEPAEFVVVRSDTRTPGEASCVVAPGEKKRLGLADNVLLVNPHNEFSVVARVVTNEELALQQAQLDQTLRNGLGLELRESVTIRPVTVPTGASRFVADAMLGRTRYVIARVQTADLATLEQGACALTPLALQLLGIESGDNVVLEGCAQPASNVVQTVKVRAFEAPGDMIALRESVSGGTLGARFPSATEALGVFPDLPWAFLDERTRRTLGLSKLEPVRIRAARGQQVGKEVRELALVIALGLIGVLISHLSAVVRIVALVALGLLIVGIVVFRLRTRLARQKPRDSG